MDGWSNNSAYTSSGTSGGFSNNGSSATSNGYGGSSSNYSNSSSNDSAYWSGVYGGSSNSGNSVATGISSSSAPAAIQSKVEAKIDAKNPTNNDGQPGSLTGQGLAGQVATPNADYWSGATDGWRSNTTYTGGKALSETESQKGVYATPSARTYLAEEVKAGRATPDMVTAGKAMIAGKENAQGQQVAGGLLGLMGSSFGPLGVGGAKAATYGIGKLQDATSEYGDNPSYQLSKQTMQDDGTLIGKGIGMVAPRGVGGFVQAAYDDRMGDYSSYINGLKSDMQKNGYISASPQRNIQQNGSSGAPNSLIANMYQTQQPADAYSYEQPSLNYDNNATYYRGSVI